MGRIVGRMDHGVRGGQCVCYHYSLGSKVADRLGGVDKSGLGTGDVSVHLVEGLRVDWY